ncbi:MAG: glycosyltransferase family 2 protein [Nitrospirota bacterium]|nr:glycosyltransferase family 2 protein [Nitrospirota bacterium]
MKISVIISTYNRPHYLGRVMEGYMNQTCRDFEIVVADDGSTEETVSIVKEAAGESDIPILHVWHPDKGFQLAKIRNKAVAESFGDYIVFTDDDCVPDPRFVLDHHRYAEDGYFLQGHRVLIGKSASGEFGFRCAVPSKLLVLLMKGEIGNFFNSVRMPCPLIKKGSSLKGIRGCNMSLFRKDFFAVNGFNEDFKGWGKEDSELVARLYKLGIKRKDVKFRACCFHLHHEFFDRDRLNRNIEILQQSVSGDIYYCRKGVDQYLRQ